LVAYDTYFEEKAPFDFIIENDSLTGVRQQDFIVKLKIKGRELPAEVFLLVDGNPYTMAAKDKNHWQYTIKNLQKEVKVQFNANGFTSRPYRLKVLPRPFLHKFEIKLDYPAYIGRKSETLHNVGDLTVPAGTRIRWTFFAENTDGISMLFRKVNAEADRKGENLFTFTRSFTADDDYHLKTRNRHLRSNDSIKYAISVVPDAYPSISAVSEQDSMRLKNLYFSGEMSDDYGFSRLTFNYRYVKSTDSLKLRRPLTQEALKFSPGKVLQPFYYFWDLHSLDIKPGDELEYYFEVKDNDGVNGAKSARTQKFYFKAPTLEELEQRTESSHKATADKMESAMRQAAQLQKELQEAQMKLMNKKNFDWQDKKMIDDILQKQQQLDNTLKEIDEEFNQNLNEQNEFKEMDPELLEKYQNLQKLMHEVLDEETRKLLEELQKLLEKNMKDEIQDNLEKMQLQNKDVEKELDRMAELFKQLQFDQELTETIEKLDELSKEQEELSKEAEQKNTDPEEIKEKQDELNKKFDELQKDLDELQKKNEELEKPHDLDDTKEQQEGIKNDMEQSSEQLQNQQKSKASQSQKNAAQKMKEMSEKLKGMQMAMQQQAQEEDYQALRQILDNLVYLSLEQEKLMADFRNVSTDNPQYLTLSARQQKLKDDAKIIEDSLLALSKR
ncbi:MAG: DUF4175 domain-containing protein, partial [Bacteroidota bacterium]|nr:DUF4175 domain-containing protein [Bacteroidota bacterium]